MGQTEAGSLECFLVSGVGTGAQTLGTYATAFLGTIADGWIIRGEAGFKLAPKWNASNAMCGLTHCATVLAPNEHLF